MIEVEPGVELCVQDVGAGTPVVLLAGFGLSSAVWDREVRVLAARRRAVCVDLRGTGRSAKPFDDYSIERMADDVSTVLDRMELEDVALLGWSFGGQIAFRVAAQRPDRVGRLILVASNGVRASRSDAYPFGRDPDVVESALIAAEEHDRLEARRTTIRSGFAEAPRADVVEFLVGCSLMMPSWAAVACYRTYLRSDLTAELDRVTMPVLQVFGGADPVHSARGADWLLDRLQDSRLVRIPGCGHYPMFEAPEAFEQALVAFLDGPLAPGHGAITDR